MTFSPAVIEPMCMAFCLALMAFLLQATLIGGAAALGAAVARRLSAHAEYVVLSFGLAMLPIVFGMTCAALVTGSPPGAASGRFDSAPLPQAVDESPMVLVFNDAGTAAEPLAATINQSFPGVLVDPLTAWLRTRLGPRLLSVSPPLVLAYGLVVAGLGLRLLLGFWGGYRLCRTAVPVIDAELLDRVRETSRRLGLWAAPALAECTRLAIPAVVGILRPTILLPTSLLSGLTPDELDAILIHELAHIRRCDPLINLLQRIVEVLFFFHPAVWWLSRRIRRVREHCCDDRVLALGASREVYIESLLRVAEISLNRRPTSAARIAGVFATGEPSQLQQRIVRLLGEPRRPTMFWTSRSLAFGVLIASAAAASPWALRAFAESELPAQGSFAEEPLAARPETAEDQRYIVTLADDPDPQDDAVQDFDITVYKLPYSPGARSERTAPAVDLTQLEPGDIVTLRVTGRTAGSVWGTDVYTADSDLATAAVHAGVVEPGQTALVRVTVLPSLPQYSGTNRHGVESRSYGSYPLSYTLSLKRVLSRTVATTQPMAGTLRSDEDREGRALATLPVGTQARYEVIGNTVGEVLGTKTYSAKSDLGAAAVHAGVLQPGERGTVTVLIVPSMRHHGSYRNGVPSKDAPPFTSSFQFVPEQPIAAASKPGTVALERLAAAGIGRSFDVELTGRVDGSVWGTLLYTADSDPATAAVHAGVIQAGERASVTITVVPSPPSFHGSSAHGVTSRGWQSWPKAFVLSRKTIAEPPMPTPVQTLPPASSSTRQVGSITDVEVIGRTDGAVWGSDVYTGDSDVATAAVHAGVLEIGQHGVVTVVFVAPPQRFLGTRRNEVTTHSYGSYPTAFVLTRKSTAPAVPVSDNLRLGLPGRQGMSRQPPSQTRSTTTFDDSTSGRHFPLPAMPLKRVEVTGRTSGAVWGTGVYTADSDLGAAAVHAGLLKPGETAMLLVCTVPSPTVFSGSTQHGVTSADFGSYPTAFVLIRSPDTPTGHSIPYEDIQGTIKHGTATERIRGTLAPVNRPPQPEIPIIRSVPVESSPAEPASALQPARP